MFENETAKLCARLFDVTNLQEKEMCAEQLRALLILGHVSYNQGDVIVKECACGRTHTISQWLQLPLVGHQVLDCLGGEVRHCQCGSTLVIITRRGEIARPKAKLLHNTYLSDNLPKERSRWNMKNQMRFINAFYHMKQPMYVDMWEERQVKEAIFEGRSPEWKVSEQGTLTPVY